MKLFRVITEHESRVKDAKPGDLLRVERYYAAANIEDVWLEIAPDRLDEEIDVLLIAECAPAVQVIEAKEIA